jgi:hypothetical protein
MMQQIVPFCSTFTFNTCFGPRWPSLGVLIYYNCYTAVICAKSTLVKTTPHAVRGNNAQSRGKLEIADVTKKGKRIYIKNKLLQ